MREACPGSAVVAGVAESFAGRRVGGAPFLAGVPETRTLTIPLIDILATQPL